MSDATTDTLAVLVEMDVDRRHRVLGTSPCLLLDALAPDVLQVDPNAQNASIRICRLVSLPGTFALGNRLYHRQDCRADRLGKVGPYGHDGG